jgi:formylglycine-generating enzyme required for sulfatase activity
MAALWTALALSSLAWADGPCPSGMANIDGKFCIDRYEASVEKVEDGKWAPHSPYEEVAGKRVRALSKRNVVPQAHITGIEAAKACSESGKRLCTEEEFRTACMGPSKTDYPYGATRVNGLCNDKRAKHPVVELFGTDVGVWDIPHMNDSRLNQMPNGLLPTGKKVFCTNSYGVYDMVGNLQEWTSTPSGVFVGGFYVAPDLNGKGCSMRTTAHPPTYHDYSIGFRCCKDAERD